MQLIMGKKHWWSLIIPIIYKILEPLKKKGVRLAGEEIVTGSRPNAFREDVYRLQGYILHYKPDCIIAIGRGRPVKQLMSWLYLVNIVQI